MEIVNPEDIKREAIRELRAEAFREAVNAEIVRLRAKQMEPWWHRLIPFTIKIEWRD